MTPAGSLRFVLPLPPGVNRIWQPVRTRGGARLIKRATYAAWKANAAREVESQRLGVRIVGKFRAHIVLSRSGLDSDAGIKPLLDACEAGGAIVNDKHCEGGTWDYDDAREGTALVILEPA